jgi:hypothetical protein
MEYIENGRRAKHYELTAPVRKELHEEAASWRKFPVAVAQGLSLC